MKQSLTQSEWNEILSSYRQGLNVEIKSGDSDHINDHTKIAAALNYFPSMRVGTALKNGSDSWTITQNGESAEVSDQGANDVINEALSTPDYFLVFPDDYTTPENAPSWTAIYIYGAPFITIQEVASVSQSLRSLHSTLTQLESRIEALERATNPG